MNFSDLTVNPAAAFLRAVAPRHAHVVLPPAPDDQRVPGQLQRADQGQAGTVWTVAGTNIDD